jgi:hypothetical protein
MVPQRPHGELLMDRQERSPDEEEILRLAFRSMQARLWTALPGIVQKFDAAANTVDVQPTINGVVTNPDGSTSSLQMPVLLDCPVAWQGGGDCTLTFPIKQGDECLVVFASRCINGWWAQGGVQDPPKLRMHNLSDGFALVGLKSKPSTFAIDTSSVQLRSDDGQAYVSINPTSHEVKIQTSGDLNVHADGNSGSRATSTASGNITATATQISLNGVTIDTSGNLNSPATITGTTDVVGGGKSLKTHKHTGVTTGGGVTGTPQ